MNGATKTTQPLAMALSFEKSARQDLRWWGLLLVGLMFTYGGYTIDPRTNCSESGECAPWLVPLALGAGLVAALGGLVHLIANPRRGSHVDVATGELVWWEGKVSDGRSQGEGRIPLSAIARVRIVADSDAADGLFLYDRQDQLMPFGGNEVVRWPFHQWAEHLADFCPGLQIDED